MSPAPILSDSAELIRPLVTYLRGECLSSKIIGTDDTRVTLLLPLETGRSAPTLCKSVPVTAEMPLETRFRPVDNSGYVRPGTDNPAA